MRGARKSILLAAPLAAAILFGAADVRAQASMDSLSLARLRTRLASYERVRVQTGSSLIEIEEARLAGEAITWRTLHRAGGAADSARIVAPLPLEEDVRIQVRRPPILPAVVLGAAAGALVSRKIMARGSPCTFNGPRIECDHNITSMVGYMSLGAAIGVAVSWRLPRWHTIWPS